MITHIFITDLSTFMYCLNMSVISFNDLAQEKNFWGRVVSPTPHVDVSPNSDL